MHVSVAFAHTTACADLAQSDETRQGRPAPQAAQPEPAAAPPQSMPVSRPSWRPLVQSPAAGFGEEVAVPAAAAGEPEGLWPAAGEAATECVGEVDPELVEVGVGVSVEVGVGEPEAAADVEMVAEAVRECVGVLDGVEPNESEGEGVPDGVAVLDGVTEMVGVSVRDGVMDAEGVLVDVGVAEAEGTNDFEGDTDVVEVVLTVTEMVAEFDGVAPFDSELVGEFVGVTDLVDDAVTLPAAPDLLAVTLLVGVALIVDEALEPVDSDGVGVEEDVGELDGVVEGVGEFDGVAEGAGVLEGVPQGVGLAGAPRGSLAAMTKLSAGLV